MSDDDIPAELRGRDDERDDREQRPLRSRRVQRVMQVVVILGLVALVLPGIVTTVSVGASTAQASCALWVAYAKPGATAADARFEVFGPSGLGWECYAVGGFGVDTHVASLGLIAGTPRIPNRAPLNS